MADSITGSGGPAGKSKYTSHNKCANTATGKHRARNNKVTVKFEVLIYFLHIILRRRLQAYAKNGGRSGNAVITLAKS